MSIGAANSEMNEASILHKVIIPALIQIGWDKERMDYEFSCKAGDIDLLYRDERGRPLVVLEAKRLGKVKQNTMDEQAIPYAKAVRAPIAIVWDGGREFETRHIKTNEALRDYDDNLITKHTLLTESNLMFFRSARNNSLKAKIKTADEMRKVFSDMNRLGRKMGLTSGMERVVEIAKILFVKMLCDNRCVIYPDDWDRLMGGGESDVIRSINNLLEKVADDEGGDSKIDIAKIGIKREKTSSVWEVVKLLDEVSLNHNYYDITGSLFEEFLSERMRGGGTNDLGQYFTPKKIIKLLYTLSKYKDGDRVYDPYCGTGGILLSFFQQNTKNMQNDETKKDFGKKYLYGNEISGVISMLAKMNMVIAGDGHSNIYDIDSLLPKNPYIQDNERFDVVATNMPFDPEIDNDVASEYFDIASDSNEIAKYIEHCLNRCKKGGYVVLITSKGFLTEKASTKFRRRLLERYCVESVYMLYDGLFRPYTDVFSCLLVIRKVDPKEYIDFFSVKDDEDIAIVKQWHGKDGRYDNGFYSVKTKDIIANADCDWRGRIYKNLGNSLKIRDLVNYVEKTTTSDIRGKLKMTTPNSVQEGIQMIPTMSNKLVEEGTEDSFKHTIVSGAIVIARITNKRIADGRYLGSAMAGDHAGNLITGEYHQIVPKNPNDLYYILHWLRGREFQKIVELAKGTGGQQRIEVDLILNEPIPEPNDELRKIAESELLAIENSLVEIKRCNENIELMKAKIAEVGKEE